MENFFENGNWNPKMNCHSFVHFSAKTNIPKIEDVLYVCTEDRNQTKTFSIFSHFCSYSGDDELLSRFFLQKQ